jgi:predicted alpha/beta hydrolase
MIDGSASEPGPKRLNFSDERPVMPGSTRDEPVCWAGSSVGLLGHTNPQKARLLDGQVRNMSGWISQRGRRAANKLLCLTSLPLIAYSLPWMGSSQSCTAGDNKDIS